MSCTMIDHQQRFHWPKHNTTKSMVGLFPLAPHHDSLQYIHHVHLMQRGQNWGVTVDVVMQTSESTYYLLVLNIKSKLQKPNPVI